MLQTDFSIGDTQEVFSGKVIISHVALYIGFDQSTVLATKIMKIH